MKGFDHLLTTSTVSLTSAGALPHVPFHLFLLVVKSSPAHTAR